VEFVRSVDHALRGRIVIELHQRIGEAHLRLGDATQARAALDLAVEAYERRMRTGAADAMSPYYAAGAHALRGEREPALACLERAAAGRPRSPRPAPRSSPRSRRCATSRASARSSPWVGRDLRPRRDSGERARAGERRLARGTPSRRRS